MNWLKTMFGRPAAAPRDAGLYLVVRCQRCGTMVRVRVDVRNDLSLNDDSTGYLVRKVVVDDRCFSRIEVQLQFDSSRRQIAAEVHGGTLVEEDTP